MIDRERLLYRIYLSLLSFNQKIKNVAARTKEGGEEWHKKHSKAREFVDGVFQSEVITDIINEQDKPGAVNNRVESSNMDVAD